MAVIGRNNPTARCLSESPCRAVKDCIGDNTTINLVTKFFFVVRDSWTRASSLESGVMMLTYVRRPYAIENLEIFSLIVTSNGGRDGGLRERHQGQSKESGNGIAHVMPVDIRNCPSHHSAH
jgi:hypothetical protein